MTKWLLAEVLVLVCWQFCQGQVYYPLAPGNVWEYSLTAHPSGVFKMFSEHDTLMPNGHSYGILSGELYRYPRYHRQSGNRVYEFLPSLQREILLYDFDLSAGDLVSSTPIYQDTLDVSLFSVDTLNHAQNQLSMNRREWIFGLHYRQIVDADEVHFVVDSLGLIRLDQEWGEFDLRGAIINGVKYGTVTAVEKLSPSIPIEYKLEQNYPNPFNPSTVIRYSIPAVERSGASLNKVTLRVYDTLGREVVTLVDEVRQPGEYSVRWDAFNQPSGVYFCRLKTKDFTATKKLLLVR